MCKLLNLLIFNRQTNKEIKSLYKIFYGDEPVVLFFKDKKYYRYPNKNFDYSGILDFALRSYESSSNQYNLPVAPTLLS